MDQSVSNNKHDDIRMIGERASPHADPCAPEDPFAHGADSGARPKPWKLARNYMLLAIMAIWVALFWPLVGYSLLSLFK